MAYATIEDLVPALIDNRTAAELTRDDGRDEPDTAVIDRVLTEASALVDSYCRRRYTVPMQPSEQIRSLTLSIARYKLFLRRRRVPDEINRDYDDAMQQLRDISNGKASLDQPTGEQAQSANDGVVETSRPEVFSNSNLEGFI